VVLKKKPTIKNANVIKPKYEFLSRGSVISAKGAFQTGKGVIYEKSNPGCNGLLIASS
jgi:hypothetical protein